MVICPACNRFVRESTCPFCGAAASEETGAAVPSARVLGHHSRVVLALGAATSVSLAMFACSGESTTTGTDAGQVGFPSYGAAMPIDASVDGTGASQDATTTDDGPMGIPAYGIAVDAAQPVDEAGSDQ